MRAFACPDCRRLVIFESLECLHSDTPLAFDWDAREIVALREGRACANRELIGCNGLAGPTGLCGSCALTRTRPRDADHGRERFAKAEEAKRRLLFELLELGLPVSGYLEGEGGVAFDMLNSEREPVTTGHRDGVITLDLAEADDAHREKIRAEMGEPYRTLLGHLRHEIGHYYEPILCPEGSPERERYRGLFGDERADYQEAMDGHYQRGAPPDWPERFVSAYATMHPFEDWAETFAHYLHIRDAVQTAIAYGVTVTGPSIPTSEPAPLYSFPSAAADGIQGLLDAWLPMTYALNALNRSLGAGDLYPFVLAPAVIEKLGFTHQLITPRAR
ncbi:MAG TPA: putative zinc-binding metallopeptidase [Solirubrobacteraceae bacterium]|nr:putative zinc-binding metallopeptidase [Solirubrobacteraceae bacterium]